MTLRTGIDISYADEHPHRRPEHLHVVAAIIGDQGAGTAVNGQLYRENTVENVGTLYAVTSPLGQAIAMFEAIEDITLVVLPATIDGLERVEMDNEGTGYTSPPAVTLAPKSGGNGAGAQAHAVVTNGKVSVVVDQHGEHYDKGIDVTIAAPSSGTTATANGIVSRLLHSEMNHLEAAEGELHLDAHPDVIVAPDLFNDGPDPHPTLAYLRRVAKSMRAKIITDAYAGNSPTDALRWATGNLAADQGDLQRVRATPNTVGWSGHTSTPGSILLAALTAEVQNDELGEDVMNRILPLITSVSPNYTFDIEDASTEGQVLANGYLTPIVSLNGTYRFWGRKVASGNRGDAGFQWVLEDAVRGLKKFFSEYIGRNQPPGELVLQCSIYNERLQHRVRIGQLFLAACIPDPRHGGGTGVDVHTDSAYVLLAIQRTPSSDKFVFSLDTNTGAVEALEGL